MFLRLLTRNRPKNEHECEASGIMDGLSNEDWVGPIRINKNHLCLGDSSLILPQEMDEATRKELELAGFGSLGSGETRP